MTDRNAMIFGAPNRLLNAAFSGPTVYTDASGNFPSNRPNEDALSFGNTSPRNTWLKLVPPVTTYPMSSDGIGLVHVPSSASTGLNGWSPTAQYRVITGLGITPRLERVAPNAVTVTSYSGAVGDIDEQPWFEDTSAAVMAETAATGPTVLLVDFATPANTPMVGASLQCFAVEAKSSSTSPSWTVELYESGSLKASLGTMSFTAANTYKKFVFYWNASLLATASGANAQIRISRAGSTPSGTLSVAAVEWIADTSSGAISEDSGYVTFPAWDTDPLLGWTDPMPYGIAPQRTIMHIWAATRSYVDNYGVFIRDPILTGNDESRTLGTVVAGEAWTPSRVNFARSGAYVKWRDPAQRKRTPAGSVSATYRRRFRELTLAFNSLPKNQTWSAFDRIDARLGAGTPLLVCAYPDGTHVYERSNTTLFARLKDDAEFSHGSHQRTRRTYVFEEAF